MGYSGRVTEALAFAHSLHKKQLRKGSDLPYMTHLLGVAALVGEAGGTEEEFIAALLHDAVEDQGGEPTLVVIEIMFGPAVAQIVAGCTDSAVQPKPPWRERKEAYLARLHTESDGVVLVSCADKTHNLRSIVGDLRTVGEVVWERFKGKKAGSLWYYRSLHDIYRERDVPRRLFFAFEDALGTMLSLAS